MEEFGKVKKEFEEFKKIRKLLGLKSYAIMNVEAMKKNLRIEE